ncbi:MAG: UDP-glucose 4-epimerase GalE [Bacteroidales bacterium]|nr:UDP-glucose 4-epimerase GalE [Bacteroidales bacterium]
MSKQILVTGGCGYIGSHTCVELFEAGYEPIIVDDLSNSEPTILEGIEKICSKKITFYQVDCLDSSKLEDVFKKHSFAAVIHFAALKAVGESVHKPLDYYQNNLGSLINLLYLMRKYSVENIVFSSSCTVYGQADVLPVTEQTPRKAATSPYGATKQMCEDILRDSISAYGCFKGIALRYFNPIGAHPSALIGELPRGIPNNLLPLVTQPAAGIRPMLNVFGNDYNTPDGSCIRDYIDVVDLAKAHVMAVDRMCQGRSKANFEIFNIGTGRGVSTIELIKTFEEVNHLKLNWQIVARRDGDIEAVWADTSYSNNELGWKATRPLSETLKSVWKWQQNITFALRK